MERPRGEKGEKVQKEENEPDSPPHPLHTFLYRCRYHRQYPRKKKSPNERRRRSWQKVEAQRKQTTSIKVPVGLVQKGISLSLMHAEFDPD
jgi:hypothetical protein